MNESEFIKIFINPLHKDKLSLNKVNAVIYDEVIHMADQFLMPTQIINNFIYNKSTNNSLIKRLNKLANISKLKNLINKKEIVKIAKLYNDNHVDYVFLKGSAINLLSHDYTRYSRDIDILVSKNSIPKAYQLLKEIGYRYANPLVSDTTKYINYGHHLPVMSDSKGSFVEIHHRVTRKLSYKECPLTKSMINQNMCINMHGVRINISDLNHTIAHLIYHAVVQHEYSLGPIFLYDIRHLRNILEDEGDLFNLLDQIGLEKNYKEIVDFIDNKREIDSFGIYSKYKTKLSDTKNLKKINYLLFTRKGILHLIDIIKAKFRNNEDYFQTSKYSFRFYFILLIYLKRHIVRMLKN